jgi:hypothetical protein
MQPTNTPKYFSLELVAMVAVITISSWHVGNYMNTFDGWVMAAIMGATLGFCNFLMAHNIFKPDTTKRLPSFCGLVFFACTSTYMQYTYFNANTAIGKTMLLGVNVDALALGLWAPAAEILLGWIYAAGLKAPTHVQPSPTHGPSKFERLTEALTGQLEQRLNIPPIRSIEQQTLPAHRYSQSEPDGRSTSAQLVQPLTVTPMNGQSPSSPILNKDSDDTIQIQPLPKDKALERILAIYRDYPTASYEEIGRQVGRSKATIANYVKELKQRHRIRITNGTVEVLAES